MEAMPEQEEPRLPDTDDWVAVAEALSPGEAEGMADALQAAGIPFREDERVNRSVTHASIVEAPVAFTDVFVILVPRSLIEQAKQILRRDGHRLLRTDARETLLPQRKRQLIEDLFMRTHGFISAGLVLLFMAVVLLLGAPKVSPSWDPALPGVILILLGCCAIFSRLALRYLVASLKSVPDHRKDTDAPPPPPPPVRDGG